MLESNKEYEYLLSTNGPGFTQTNKKNYQLDIIMPYHDENVQGVRLKTAGYLKCEKIFYVLA